VQAELAREWPVAFQAHADPASFLARALATRALLGGALRANLRAGSFAHPALLAHARRLRVAAAAAAAAAGLVLLSGAIGAVAAAAHREAAFDTALAELADRLAGYHVTARGSHALQAVREASTQRREVLGPFRGIVEPSRLGALGDVVRAAAGSGVRLELVEWGRDRSRVEGSAPDAAGVRAVTAALAAADGRVAVERQDAGADGRIVFAIKAEGAP
jgi:hypothetical protein